MGQGSRERDLLGELVIIFSNLILCCSRKSGGHRGRRVFTVEKVENIVGGESWVMCCKLTEAGLYLLEDLGWKSV